MRLRGWPTLFLLIAPLLFGTSVQALDLSRLTTSAELSGELRIAEVPAGEPQETPPQSDAFRPSTARVPAFGYTNSTFWASFNTSNGPGDPSWILEFAASGTDEIELFRAEPHGLRSLGKAGDRTPFGERSILHPHFFFSLTEPPGSAGSSYFLRIRSTSSLSVPLRAWRPEALASRIAQDHFENGLFYGGLLLLLFLNAVICWVTRDRTYLLYLGFLGSSVLFQAANDSTAFRYLWPDATRWNSVSTLTLGLVAIWMGSRFVRRFLTLDVHQPNLLPFFRATEAAAILNLLLIALPWVEYRYAAHTSLFVGAAWGLLSTGAGFHAIRRGFSPARLYTASWYLLFTGIAVYILRMANWVPWNAFTLSAVRIGSFLEAVAMSLALAERLRVLAEEARTDRRRLAEEKFRSQVLEAENRLAAQVAHDIRAPLAALGVLERELKGSDPMAQELLRSVLRRVQEIAEDLLKNRKELRRSQERSQSGQLEELDLTALACRVFQERRTAFADLSGVRWAFSAPESPLKVWGCAPELSRVLSNLLNNAVEALPPAGGSLSVQLLAPATLVIADTGEGMEPNLVWRFQAGQRLDSQKPQGHGLGLSHARETLQAWGARIEIQSIRKGAGAHSGTTVSLHFQVGRIPA
jgi:signal transduction histidine kinase